MGDGWPAVAMSLATSDSTKARCDARESCSAIEVARLAKRLSCAARQRCQQAVNPHIMTPNGVCRAD